MEFNQAYYFLSRVRSLNYFIEYSLLRAVGEGFKRMTGAPGGSNQSGAPQFNPQKFKILERELNQVFRKDSERIGKGIYPPSVLIPEDPRLHLKRIPLLVWDGIQIIRRRQKNKTKEFDKKAHSRSQKLPEYYTRNFHFQTDGYLSEHSAELYEHQVELLFAGSADAMRRLIIAPLKETLQTHDGDGLTFLEIAAGTGRASRFVRLAFPKAKIVVSDISAPYLKVARRKLADFDDLSFVEAAAENLPFRDKQFDAVYSSFLFHELPLEVRKQVLKESRRVLRSGGFLGAVDSLQLGDVQDFDVALKDFPKEFHEPFYANYIQHPLEEIFSGDALVRTETGFLSKVVWTKHS